VHISAPYLQELYKKAFGISCMNDVIECRIAYAKSLLVISDMRIEEIATRCGYKSLIHFSRQFRKITGSSPTEWRRENAMD
ncbi:MAG: helix-turn-helix transcriptional regulator, partial [Ruminococcus sp.]|nr:helix-turn-helix transcriptional regulator [Ruminococcus sp.]